MNPLEVYRLSSRDPPTVIILAATADASRGRDGGRGRGCDDSDGVIDQWCDFHNIYLDIGAPFVYVIHFIGFTFCVCLFRKIFLFVC